MSESTPAARPSRDPRAQVLSDEWQVVYDRMEPGKSYHPQDLWALPIWRRSYGQLCHALRRMRDWGLLDSPTRGRFRRPS